MKKTWGPFMALCLILAVTGCGKKTEDQKAGGSHANRGTLITVATVQKQSIERVQESIGRIESDSSPSVAAEASGRVVKVMAESGQRVSKGQVLAAMDAQDAIIARDTSQAETQRLRTLIANQERLLQRYEKLAADKFISANQMDDAVAQLDTLREQLAGAQAQLAGAQHNLEKTKIIAPVAGEIEQRLVSVGDYVDRGKPLFHITASQKLRIHLPFPEDMAGLLRRGMPIRLVSASAPEKSIETTISDIQPAVNTNSHALEAMVEMNNPGGWKPGGSVKGILVLERRSEAIVVPEQSVVLRPAGEVVYVINGDVAEQHVVKTGHKAAGNVEIVSGVVPGQVVAFDGAAFLTDKAKVNIKKDVDVKKDVVNQERHP